MTRRHAGPNNTLLTKNLPFVSYIRQSSHPLMIPLHFLCAKSNAWWIWMWCDWFCFDFDFVCLHARCSCCPIVCLRFEVVQIKQTQRLQLDTKYKATEKQIVKLQLNEKKSKESQTGLMSWYWKLVPTWRKDLIAYNSHSWIMFSFTWLVLI